MPQPLRGIGNLEQQFITGKNLIASWTVPVKGVLHNWPVQTPPPDALFDAQNCTIRHGRLITRPGRNRFTTLAATGIPNGMFQAAALAASGAFDPLSFDPASFFTASNLPSSYLFLSTTLKLYISNGTTYFDVTGATSPNATRQQLGRFCALYINSTGKLNVYFVDSEITPQKYDTSLGTAGTFSNVAGAPPVFSDLASIADHLIGIVPPYGIRWSNNQDDTTWSSLNVRILTDGGDRPIAIRNLGQYGGVVFKQRSLWTVFPQGGAESTFFVFTNRGSYDGPAGVNAIADANGVLYWMTDTGRIGSFDGSQVLWVADGIWGQLKDSDITASPTTQLDPIFANLISGSFDSTHQELRFHYPRVGDNGKCLGLVNVSLARPMDNIMAPIAFCGNTSLDISAAGDRRLDTRDTLSADVANGFVYTEAENIGDNGATFTGFLQTPLQITPGSEFFELDAWEVYCWRGGGYGSITVKPVTSNILDVQGGTVSSISKTVDLTTVKVFEPFAADIKPARYFGLKINFSQPGLQLNYLGARLGGTPRKG